MTRSINSSPDSKDINITIVSNFAKQTRSLERDGGLYYLLLDGIAWSLALSEHFSTSRYPDQEMLELVNITKSSKKGGLGQ